MSDERTARIPIFKGYENPEQRIVCLWLNHRLRIELIENIHLHFGDDGEHRIELSKKEFLELAEAFEKCLPLTTTQNSSTCP
jgi:hypothetical protein